jgi:NADH-quinone oxidoreductase subunit J
VLEAAVFWTTAVVALGAGVAMVLSRNAVHAALFLVATQLTLAVMFLLQGAFFIAALQIIIYAGAIMVLFVFVVMLLGVDKREALIEPLAMQRPLAVALGLLLAAEVTYLALSRGFRGRFEIFLQRPPVEGNVEVIARELFTNWALPFEATSLLLVVAVVGAVVLAKRRLEP